MLLASLLVLYAATIVDAFTAPIKVNDKLPWVDLDFDFPPIKVPLPAYAANKRLLVVGLPGAFTPT